MTGNTFEISVETRLRDLDPSNHVNNPVHVVYLQESRVKFFADLLELSLDQITVAVAHTEIDYHRSIKYEDDVRVHVRPGELGEASIPIEYEVYADDELAVTASTVHVWVDDEGDSTPIPDYFRKRFTNPLGE